MKILFLHGWHSVVGGVKPTYLKDAGHEVMNPALDDDDFNAAVHTAQAEFDLHQPDVIVGSSRGGAVAMNIVSGETPLVLLCPAWKNWGTARTLKANSVILHSRDDEVIPFSDSEELIANSGLPSEMLIEIGCDHRLADPEPLAMMLSQACLSVPTLCIGIDTAWWGGSKGKKASQRDTAVSAIVARQFVTNLSFHVANLSLSPNSSPSQSEPNFDHQSELLWDMIERVRSSYQQRFVRCVLALDTPLEFANRANTLPRLKSVPQGQSNNSTRRACERDIDQYKSATQSIKGRAAWNRDLRIQSGYPVSPRIEALIQRLDQEGFKVWGQCRKANDTSVIECFPSEAQWALGINGRYGHANSVESRRYKRKEKAIPVADARAQVHEALSGFVCLLSEHFPALDCTGWVQQIATHAVSNSLDAKATKVRKGKGFDDPIDSGMAFFTSIAFAFHRFHAWGDGNDGTIVGPDAIPQGEYIGT